MRRSSSRSTASNPDGAFGRSESELRNVFTALRRFFGGFQKKIAARDHLPKSIQEHFDFSRFVRTIGYQPRNWDLFVEALLHRSYTQHVGEKWRPNERLEFLGDAVLNFLVADHLLAHHPKKEEGDLTKIRSRLVNRRILAERSKELHINEFLFLSTSAAQSGSESILSDAFEALIGALYLDGGIEVAREFVGKTLLLREEILEGALTDDNYKSALLEYSQANSTGIPHYVIAKEDGPDHDRRFTVDVFVGSQHLGSGTGRSKKEAEQAAAAEALERIQKKN